MKVFWATMFVVLLLAAECEAQLQSNRQTAKLGEITQLRPDFTIPDGFSIATQRWIPVYTRGKCHGVSFNGGQVFAVTSATPGARMRVIWDVAFVNWDAKQFKQDSREFIIDFEGDLEDPVGPPPGPDNPPGPRKVVQVVYVHERRDQIVPRPIQAGLQKLNQQGFSTAAIDKDQLDGMEEVPDQFKAALEAARQHGVPVLVVGYSDGTTTVTKPKTEQEVLEAVK